MDMSKGRHSKDNTWKNSMSKINVFIVDDAVVVRRLLAKALAQDPDIEVIGNAANGRIALTKIPQVNPDVIVLDIEMPEMDGLETLTALRKDYPRLPIIMFSTLTERGAISTLDALARGANDYVTKPSNVGKVEEAFVQIRDKLIPKIKTFCRHTVEPKTTPTKPVITALPSKARPLLRTTPARRIDVVAIGVSTGGPNALATLLPKLPADFPVPIVIVQHMPPLFTKHLADRLTTQSALQVVEGVPGALLRPGQVWIAPGDFHMMVKRAGTSAQLDLHQKPPENFCRPSADVLFRSVAEVYGAHALALVMTGMGQDGLRGCRTIQEAGGQVVVQDKASAVVWGMAGYVAKAGLADAVLPLDQLANELMTRLKIGRATSSPATTLRANHRWT